jgi:phage baseplate assembly protein W
MAKKFSTEDGKLETSIRVVKERDYSDIDLSLNARTPTSDGDVFKKTDAASVKQAVKNLLMTNRFEKPYRPNYGADLGGLLFELMDEDTGEEIIGKIKKAIQRYEPRAKVLNVKVVATPDYNNVSVVVEFRVVATGLVETLKVSLNPSTPTEIPSLPITTEPFIIYNDIIRAENEDRLATYRGDLVKRDLVIPPVDALLTDPDSDMIFALFNGFIEGVLLIDSDLLEGILTVPDGDQISLQNGEDFLLPEQVIE